MKLDLKLELPADSFDYERAAVVAGISIESIWDWQASKLRDGFTFIGWCPAKNIRIRPKKDSVVVMVEEDETGDRIWLHFPDHMIERDDWEAVLSDGLKED